MKYYTITLEHVSKLDGHTRAIMILSSRSEEMALNDFLLTFGFSFKYDAKVYEGIHIEGDFERLLTEQVCKYLLKIKNKMDETTPALRYQNMIQLRYTDEV